MKLNKMRVNEAISADQVRLIDSAGKQLGVVNRQDALKLAKQDSLDLVEIDSKADPIVCRITDFGKFKYLASKRSHDNRSKQKHSDAKEVKFRVGTGTGDFDYKLKQIKHFIEEGHRVKISLWFRGREIQHKNIGENKIEMILQTLGELVLVEQAAKLEGKKLTVVLVQNKKKPTDPVTKPTTKMPVTPKSPPQ